MTIFLKKLGYFVYNLPILNILNKYILDLNKKVAQFKKMLVLKKDKLEKCCSFRVKIQVLTLSSQECSIEAASEYFYEDGENSHKMPGQKNFVSISWKVQMQKQLLLSTLKELFVSFKILYPHVKLGFSKFCILGLNGVFCQTHSETIMCAFLSTTKT